MTVPRVNLGDPITKDGQNALIDQSNANQDPNVAGMFWASGFTGHTGAIQPPAGVNERYYELSQAMPSAKASAFAYPRPWDSVAQDYVTDLEADTVQLFDNLGIFRGRARDEGAPAETDSGGTRGKHGSFCFAVERNGRWEVQLMQLAATWIEAGTDGTFAKTDFSINVSGVLVILPHERSLLMADVTSVRNAFEWEGAAGVTIYATWNDRLGETSPVGAFIANNVKGIPHFH